jgi:hypothetical protein
MSRKTIALPSFAPKFSPPQEVDYAEFLASFKRQADTIPDFVRALKKADNAGWQQLIDDLGAHIQADPKLKKFIKAKAKDGAQGLSVGEPNWFIVAAAVAFGAGYAIGTACYKLGPCNFVR